MSVGRNDPCPCGSGKKYKKCCGAVIALKPAMQPAQRQCGSCTACCDGWVEGTIRGHEMKPGVPCHFRGAGCFLRMNMHRQGKLAKDYAQLTTVIVFDTR